MSKITCPHCHSENVQAFRVIFEGGTATAVHHTSGVGVGFSDSGSIGLGVGGAQTTTTSMSILAEKAAPPGERKLPGWMSGLGIVSAAGALLGSIFDPGARALAALVAGGIIFLYVRNYNWNKDELPKLQAEWEKKFLCHTCGGDFSL